MSKPEFIYGTNAVTEAIAERPDIVVAVHGQSAKHGDVMREAREKKITVAELDYKNPPTGVEKDAPHQGLIAQIQLKKLLVSYKDFMQRIEPDANTAVAILGEIQDPHNVGAIIRSAAAFGLSAVFIPPHRQAGVTATVIKVSAGMAFRVPLVEISNVNTTIRDLKNKGFWVYGLAGDEGSVSVSEEHYDRAAAFVVGNEGEGLRAKTRETCDTLLQIPMHPRCESLNASVAAAVTFQNWSQQHPDSLA